MSRSRGFSFYNPASGMSTPACVHNPDDQTNIHINTIMETQTRFIKDKILIVFIDTINSKIFLTIIVFYFNTNRIIDCNGKYVYTLTQ